jgi:hypothetical protein
MEGGILRAQTRTWVCRQRHLGDESQSCPSPDKTTSHAEFLETPQPAQPIAQTGLFTYSTSTKG